MMLSTTRPTANIRHKAQTQTTHRRYCT